MIIVSITGPDMEEALRQVAASEQFADMFEFRLDLIVQPSMSGLFQSTGKPIIATCRPIWEGGGFRGDELQRAEVLEAAALFGVDYIDIEMKAWKRLSPKFRSRLPKPALIASLHLPAGSTINVPALFGKLDATGADVVKLAFMARDASDNMSAFEFLRLARERKRNGIAIAMGEEGEPSRILYRKFGGWATYASAEGGNAAASGQLPARQLRQTFRAHDLGPSTKVYGVVGGTLRQSKGVYVHNELFRRAGKDAVYCKFAVKNLKSFMRRMGQILDGMSVTIPHKETMLKLVDSADRTARAIGAINTVLRRRGKLLGSNTDASAALDAIEAEAQVRGKRMLVFGAGGAARAIAYEAVRRGAVVTIANRTASKAARLARRFGVSAVPVNQIASSALDIFVNASSVGMVPAIDETPVPPAMLAGKVVFDVVYNPPQTRLLREAAAAGATIIAGTEMYINQAARQSKLFAGREPDIRLMRAILAGHLAPPRRTESAGG